MVTQEVTASGQPYQPGNGPCLLLVDDEVESLYRIEFALRESEDLRNTQIFHATTLPMALKILSETPIDVVLLDKNLGADPKAGPNIDLNGIEAIPEIVKLQPQAQILVLTGSNDLDDVVRAMSLGAYSYIQKDRPNALLVSVLLNAIHVADLKRDKVRRDRMSSPDLSGLGGKSKIFRNVLDQALECAESDRPILILGESGTGKTELAKWIHRYRAQKLKLNNSPFFNINVAVFNREGIESELFGHERGAFTDAIKEKQGLFELANHGTLFLDEIGELPYDLQPVLLKVIDEGVFKRMGGSKMLHTNPKLILATNRNLAQRVSDGQFRADLLRRIEFFQIKMPSLRERKEDIPDLVRVFLPNSCRISKVNARFEDIPKDFLEFLKETADERNIRGLQHHVEKLLVSSPKDKNGQPIFAKWQKIPAFCSTSPQVNQLVSQAMHDSETPLTYSEMMSRPWELLEPTFPGYPVFLEEIKNRVAREVSRKFKTNRDRSRALKYPETSTFDLIRAHKDIPASKRQEKV